MSIPLILTNLKSARWGALAWGVSVLLMGLFVVNLFSTMGEGMSGMLELIESYPEQLRIAMFGSTTVPGADGEGFTLNLWISTEFLAWSPLLMAIYAIFSAGTGLAQEVERGTIDLLLSQPVARYRVVISRFATFALTLTAILAAGYIGLLLGDATIEANLDLWATFLAIFQIYLLVLAVGSYCLFFSCLFLQPRRALIASGILTTALYIINFVAPSLGSADWLQKLSLFHYYRPPEILNNSQMDAPGVTIYVTVAAVFLLSSLVVFQRRDISP
jgi:ABC-2 type transport system permease protein